MKTVIIAAVIFFSIFSYSVERTWDELSKSDQADILYDLSYSSGDELVGVQVIDLLTEENLFTYIFFFQIRRVGNSVTTHLGHAVNDSVENNKYWKLDQGGKAAG